MLVSTCLVGCVGADVVPKPESPGRVTYVQVDRTAVIHIAPQLWAVMGARLSEHPTMTEARRGPDGMVYLTGDLPWLATWERLQQQYPDRTYACGWPDGLTQTPDNALIIERRIAVVLKSEVDPAVVLTRLGLVVVDRVGDHGYLLDSGPDPLSALAGSIRLATDPAVAGCNPVIRVPRFPKAK